MRIGITGSNGFIGTSLLSHLAQSSYESIRIVRRNSTSSIPSSNCPIEVVHGDLSSPKICEQFIQGIDVIFYLAHCNSPSTSELDLPADALLNLVPLLTMIQAVRNAKSTPHVVYFGSGGAIYAARSKKVPFKETDPCGPVSSYGIQKMMAEEYLRVAASRSELTATVLRVGNAYGSILSSFRKQGLIGVTIGNVMSRRPVTLFGSLENVRDNIHLEDICDLCSMLLEPSNVFSIYNVGTGVGHSVQEVFSTIEECFGVRISYQIGRSPSDYDVFPPWNVLDISRVTKEIGWTPKIALREGVSKMIKSAQHSEQLNL